MATQRKKEDRDADRLRRTLAAQRKQAAWRTAVIADARQWAELSGERWDYRLEQTIVRRLSKLETAVRLVYGKDCPDDPFDPHDAAGLILLPKHKAFRLHAQLFNAWAKRSILDLDGYNLDWLYEPKGMA